MRLAAIAVLCAAVISTNAQSFELCDDAAKREEFYAARKPWEKALGEKRYDDLDKYFNGLLEQQEAGKLPDAMAQRSFAIFEDARPRNEPLHIEWVRKYPKSQAAHLALAYHYASRGYAARGSGFARETSREQFALMEDEFRKALVELDAADRLGKAPTLSAAHRIAMAARIGGDPTSIYRKTIEAYPSSLEARIQYITVSAPKWGGSMKQLASIIDDAKALPAADKRYIEYLVYQEMGNAHACTKEPAALCGPSKPAVEYYEKSIALCPAFDNSLNFLLSHAVLLKDYPVVIKAASRAIERHPRGAKAYTTRGWAYLAMGKQKESLADYEHGTQLGYGPAYEGLAWFYETGTVVPRDYRKAIDLYMIAASHDVEGAKQKADNVRRGAGIDMK